jgi:VanZ family protein
MKFFRYWGPVILYMGMIWYLSSFSFPPQPSAIVGMSDTLKHTAEFFILALLVYRAVFFTVNVRYSYIITIIFTTVYGIIDEIHQGFIPGRIASLTDVFFDALGGLLIMSVKIVKKWQARLRMGTNTLAKQP